MAGAVLSSPLDLDWQMRCWLKDGSLDSFWDVALHALLLLVQLATRTAGGRVRRIPDHTQRQRQMDLTWTIQLPTGPRSRNRDFSSISTPIPRQKEQE